MVTEKTKKASATTKKAAPAPKAAAAKVAAPKAPKAVSAKTTTDTATTAAADVRRKRGLVGSVVSDKMAKTIVVKVDRQVRHGLYEKYLTRSRRFKAHDETNEAKMGDVVEIIECRPISRDKRWALKKVIRRSIPAVALDI